MTSLREQMDTGRMSGYQWGTVALCVLLNVVDGFDILVVAYTATSLTNEWGLSGSVLGLLLSAGLLGMALGTFLIAPLADRFGRRPVVLSCLALASAGMLASAAAPNASTLGVLRLITGLGMGGIIVSANVIASEFASRRWRGLAVSLNTTGYAFGAMSGGLVAVWLQSEFTWRAVYLFGAVITAAAWAVLLVRMPESVDWLYLGRHPRALDRVNVLAAKMRKRTVEDLVATGGQPGSGGRAVSRLFSPAYRRTTLLVCAGFFLNMFGFYFVQSWTPRLLADAGLSESQGNLGGTILNLGAMASGLVVGFLLARFRLAIVLPSFFAIAGSLMCVFAVTSSQLTVAFGVVLLIGLCVNGCMGGLYTLATGAFDPAIRSTGVGWGITVGRIGAVVSPAVAGLLVDADWGPRQLYLAMSLPFFVAGAAVLLVGTSRSPHLPQPAHREPADTDPVGTEPAIVKGS